MYAYCGLRRGQWHSNEGTGKPLPHEGGAILKTSSPLPVAPETQFAGGGSLETGGTKADAGRRTASPRDWQGEAEFPAIDSSLGSESARPLPEVASTPQRPQAGAPHAPAQLGKEKAEISVPHGLLQNPQAASPPTASHYGGRKSGGGELLAWPSSGGPRPGLAHFRPGSFGWSIQWRNLPARRCNQAASSFRR